MKAFFLLLILFMSAQSNASVGWDCKVECRLFWYNACEKKLVGGSFVKYLTSESNHTAFPTEEEARGYMANKCSKQWEIV